MKITQLLFVTAMAAILFASCKKSSSNNSSSLLPKTYNENVTSSISGNENVTFNLSYDGSNRLTSIIATKMPGLKQLYTYNADGSFSMDLFDDGTNLSIHENFFLNSYKLVDSTFQYDDSQDTTTEKYFYNSSKQLTSFNEYNYSKVNGTTLTNTTTYQYDNNGNVTSATDFNSTITYTYTNLVSPLYIGPDYFAHNKYLVQTTTVTTGGSTDSATETYTFDSSNRLVTDKAVASNGDVIIKTYTY